jgi:hypothetical protein
MEVGKRNAHIHQAAIESAIGDPGAISGIIIITAMTVRVVTGIIQQQRG